MEYLICKCQSCRFNPSILRHTGIWGAGGEALWHKGLLWNPKKSPHKKLYQTQRYWQNTALLVSVVQYFYQVPISDFFIITLSLLHLSCSGTHLYTSFVVGYIQSTNVFGCGSVEEYILIKLPLYWCLKYFSTCFHIGWSQLPSVILFDKVGTIECVENSKFRIVYDLHRLKGTFRQ